MERGRESPASSTFPIAASSLLSAAASAPARAAPLFERRLSASLSLFALRRLGQSRCQCVPPQCLHFT
eukprot:380802-Pleurochrysis_carterae.AAC.1